MCVCVCVCVYVCVCIYDGCNDLVTATFDSLLIRGLNEADLWAIITEFSYVA